MRVIPTASPQLSRKPLQLKNDFARFLDMLINSQELLVCWTWRMAKESVIHIGSMCPSTLLILLATTTRARRIKTDKINSCVLVWHRT